MTDKTTDKKKKRELKNINFSSEGSHIALCTKEQGVANESPFALVLKQRTFSEEFVQKLQSVKVEMEVPEFLRRFFGLYYEDAEVLARIMGYVPVESDDASPVESYEDYIQSKLQSYELMKSANESGDFASIFAELTEDDYLAWLEDQEMLEKSIKKSDEQKEQEKLQKELERKKPRVVTKKESTVVVKATTASEQPQISKEVKSEGVSSPVVKQEKEKQMSNPVKVEQVVETEMVEKSQFDLIQKQLADQQEELKKSRELVEAFVAKEKAAIAKARKEKLQSVTKSEANAEVFFNAVGESDEQTFESVCKALEEMSKLVDESPLFKEQGVSTAQAPVVKESLVAKAIKAQLKTK